MGGRVYVPCRVSVDSFTFLTYVHTIPCSEYSGGVKPNKEDIVEQDNKKKRERFEAARQVALKEAMARDIASRGEAEPDEEAGQSQPRTTAGRARGYDRLTVFPEGDKELEMSTGERVSSEMAITETDAARTSASQNL